MSSALQNRAVQLCGVLVALDAALALAGWLSNTPRLGSLGDPTLKGSMPPSTALPLIVLGVSLALVASQREDVRRLIRWGSGLVIVVAALRLADYVFGSHLSLDAWLFGSPQRFMRFASYGPTTLFGVTNLLSAAVAMLLLTAPRRENPRYNGALSLSIITLLMGALSALAYFYDSPLLHDAAWFHMTFNVSVSFSIVGVGLTIMASARHIDERRAIQRALEIGHANLETLVQEKTRQLDERVRLFHTFMNNSPTPAWLKDEQGRYAYVNEPMERLFNIKNDAIRGKTDAAYLPPPVAREVRENDLRVLESGAVEEIVETVPTVDGVERKWLSFKFPFEDASGRRYVGGVAVEITDRIRAEEQVRALNRELESRIARRTAALEAANRELEAFSYSVSHDLRAPLRGISGFAQILLEDHGEKLDEEGLDCAERICAAAARMSLLIDDLLGLSRVARQDLTPESVNLTDLATEIAATLCEQEPNRSVEFTVEDGLTAHGDRRLLEIAVQNLLANAWKFTSHQPDARVRFGSKPSRNGDDETVFCVEDNGAGFDMSFADKLFTPFRRLHSDSEFTGTGIGLATVRRIVRRHGGRVWAEAEPNKGARFYFTLAEGKQR